LPSEVLHQKTQKVLIITTLYKLGLVGKRAKTKEKTEWKKSLSQNFNFFLPIDYVTVVVAILTSGQTREKLQCLYENPMSNNFRKTAGLEKI